MTEITFYCPSCSAVITADASMRGDVYFCPDCGERVVVPVTPVGPGTLIDGYKVIRKIGTGGMGNVYLVEQTSMSRLVALKVLPAALTQDISFLERFLSEVRMQGSLSHPNIATAYDAGKYGEIYYMAMEYVEGSDLHEMIARHGKMDERAALKIARKIALGLGYAWKKCGLIHRDIKPSNIVIDQDAEVKLLDLGVSKSHAQFTDKPSTGELVIGTPHYMSPEQARESSSVDVRADIYSLGATLYHLVTGRPPFEGENLVEIVSKQLAEKAPAPQALNPKLSDAFVRLLDVMMAREAKRRYPDWEACAADILRVIKGSMPLANPPGAVDSLLEPSIRKNTRRTTIIAQPPPPAPTAAFPWGKVLGGLVAAAAVAGAILYGLTRMGGWLPTENGSRPTTDYDGAGRGGMTSSGVKGPRDAARQQQGEQRRELEAQFVSLTDDSQQGMSELERIRALEALQQRAEARGFQALVNQCEIAISHRTYAREEGINAVMITLSNAVAELTAEGDFGAAADLCRDYAGEWAEDTEADRLALAAAIDVMAAEATGKVLAQLVDDVAGDILSERGSASAMNRLQAAEDDPALTEIAENVRKVKEELTQALRLHTSLINTFTNQLGQEIVVQLRKGPERLVIENVAGNTVFVTKRIPQGELAMSFSLRDLTLQEKIIRLVGQQGPEANLLRGLLALEARQDGAASRLFAQSGGTLAQALADRLNRRLVKDPYETQPEFFDP